MNDTRAYLLVNLATFLWASNITLGRALRNDIGPVTLTAGRFLVAGALFAWMLRDQPAEERRPRGDGLLLLAMGLTGVFAFPQVLYLGLRYTTALNGALVNAIVPLVTALLAAVWIREPLSARTIMGAMISLAGVVFVVSRGSLVVLRRMQFNPGDLILLGAVILWAIYSILGRIVMRRRSVPSATALPIWMALPMLLVAAVLECRVSPPALSWRVLLAVIYIGVFPVFVAVQSWNASIRQLGPSRAMAFYNMLPLFGALLAVVLLGEGLHMTHLIGGVLIIGGGLLNTR